MAKLHEAHEQGHPSKGHGAEVYGDVLSPMEEVFGHKEGEYDATGKVIVNGMPDYPKGTPTELEEVAFDELGKFGKVPMSKE